MKLRSISLALLVAMLGVTLLAPLSASAQANNGPYTVTDSPVFDAVTGKRVGKFTGEISNLAFRATRDNRLLVSGVLNGSVANKDGTTTQIENQAFQGARAARPTVTAVCDVLNLDIGRITLDLLGLVIDIAPISIDITAVSGPGNLLGNLLCALVGLLD